MSLPCLHNLTSRVIKFQEPWTFEGVVPQEVRDNKKYRDKWINDPSTSWNVWSTWEGLSGTQRISKKGRDSASGEEREENPPMLCRGFVADFDVKMSRDEVASGFERLAPFLPQYYCVSLSGKCHLLWVFDKPIKVGSFELAENFLNVIADKLKIRAVLPGFDEAFFNPARYYTNGAEWYTINEKKLSYTVGLGWLIAASKKVDYKSKGYNVPLDAVRTELLKNPKFVSAWDGIDFVEGAQGPTWWIEGSESPKSAIVKESGMFTFASHAPKDFYPWGELVGFSFVDAYKADHVGNAVDGVYFDGRLFWREISRGDWKAFEKADILHYLKITRGLSDHVSKEEPHSELDLAYEFLIDHHNIEGAAPFVFKPNGILTINQKPFLNVHTARVTRPVDGAAEWGHPDHFPWISRFFGMPSTAGEEQGAYFLKGGAQSLDTFISWLSHFYKSSYELDLASGHNIFLCGPVNVGKTLLNRAIIGGLMNGYREAKEYLMGEDQFGAELFRVAHWVVDDGTMSVSLAAHRLWGEMLKRMAANKTFRYHEKFRTPQQVDWQGRVVITLNSDEESGRLLPDLSRSLLDKIDLWRTTDIPTIDFPSESEIKDILERELPYFARFLLSWKIPEHCTLRRGVNDAIDYRFGGIKPWHDPSLVQQANQSSRTAGFYEILQDWKDEYFGLVNEGKSGDAKILSWRGSAFQLRKVMCTNPATQDALRGMDNGVIGMTLSQLKSKGYRLDCEDVGEIRYWTIYSGEKVVAPTEPAAPIRANAPASKFQKQIA